MNIVAALISVFVPGLGQLVRGRIGAAIFFFVGGIILAGLSAVTFGIGLIVAVPFWAWNVANAGKQ